MKMSSIMLLIQYCAAGRRAGGGHYSLISFAKAGRSLLHGSIVSSALRLCWLSHSIARKAFRLLHLQYSSAQIFCLTCKLLQHPIGNVLSRASCHARAVFVIVFLMGFCLPSSQFLPYQSIARNRRVEVAFGHLSDVEYVEMISGVFLLFNFFGGVCV